MVFQEKYSKTGIHLLLSFTKPEQSFKFISLNFWFLKKVTLKKVRILLQIGQKNIEHAGTELAKLRSNWDWIVLQLVFLH